MGKITRIFLCINNQKELSGGKKTAFLRDGVLLSYSVPTLGKL